METAFRSDERFTQAEFVEWLRGRPATDIGRYELMDGHVVMTPPARPAHAIIEVNISTELKIHSRSTRAGQVLGSSARYELPSGDTLQPDASFVLSGKLEGRSHDGDVFTQVVPDLVVEVLSPSTARRDRTEKKAIYAKNGVTEYWIVDPVSRRITLYTLAGETYGPPLEITAGSVQSSVLPGFSIPLEVVFADCD